MGNTKVLLYVTPGYWELRLWRCSSPSNRGTTQCIPGLLYSRLEEVRFIGPRNTATVAAAQRGGHIYHTTRVPPRPGIYGPRVLYNLIEVVLFISDQSGIRWYAQRKECRCPGSFVHRRRMRSGVASAKLGTAAELQYDRYIVAPTHLLYVRQSDFTPRFIHNYLGIDWVRSFSGRSTMNKSCTCTEYSTVGSSTAAGVCFAQRENCVDTKL